ncbi:MAG: PilC/PilY family type IV pilus protein, partial [Burkholderiales bacterium]
GTSGTTIARYAYYYKYDGTSNLKTATPNNTFFPTRVDILPGVSFGPKASTRTDCAGASCTYNEEIQNFANWYSYYRTRILMTKTSLGRVFAGLSDKFRVGFNTINDTAYDNQTAPALDSAYWQNVRDFDAVQKQAWFNKLYAINPANGTPLRNQMQKIGRYFSNKITGQTDPMQYSCQSNYHILSTDGFWNDAVPALPTIGSADSNPADGYSTRASGSFDQNNQGDTLADVAMYYYKNDLRTSLLSNCTSGVTGADVCANNVKTSSKDKATHQHMSVFTIGLGAGGKNDYFEDYEIRSDKNYAGKGYDANFWLSKLKAGDTTAANNWPSVAANDPSTIDDLWHAAINGRGSYLNAGSPDKLTAGMAAILNEIAAREGSGSGAALSSNDLRTSSTNGAFSVVYDSADWSGDVVGKSVTIDSVTGLPVTTLSWNARLLLNQMVLGTGWKDTRKIFTIGDAGAPKPFVWSNLSNPQQTALGSKGVQEYLRGDNSNPLFRQRKHVLGDIVGSEPAFVAAPRENYSEAENPGYETSFQVAFKNRKPVLYVGANDGMLHAFNAEIDPAKDANAGMELWAYVPGFVYQGPTNPAVDGLAALASPTYTHRFYVDAKPHVKDVDFSRAGVDPKSVVKTTFDWHTILVSGLGKGGKGYFALDVTDPSNDTTSSEQNLANTKILWEFTDPDMGFTYGEPLITKTRKWGWVVVVSSGYNNITGPNPGQGFLFVLNAKTGALLQKIGTGVGTAVTPSGLTHFTGWTISESDFTSEQLYAGDLLGNLWRFDVSQAASVASNFPAPLKFALLTDGSLPQPVTTVPVVALSRNGVDRYVFVGTGRLLGVADRMDAQTQTLYGFRDGGKILPYVAGTLPAGATFPLGRTNLGQVTDFLVGANVTGKLGWYADLGRDSGPTSPSERVVINPKAGNGTAVFATTIPTVTDVCSSNARGNFYDVNFESGKTQLTDSTTNAPIAKVSNSDGFVKLEFVRVKGKIRVIATDYKGNVAAIKANTKGSDLIPNPHRYYWREVLQ